MLPRSQETPAHSHAGVAVRTECGTWTETRFSDVLPHRDVYGAMVWRTPDVQCPLHGVVESIVKVRDREYLSWCENCRWYRWSGQSRPDADRLSTLHHRRYPAHFVHTDLESLPGFGYYRLIAPEHVWSL